MGLAGSTLALVLAACAPSAPRPAGPIVLVSIEGLRADAVGRPPGTRGLTPNLDALAGGASFVGRAVAASSATAPAMASLLSGLQPWGHQLLADGDRLPDGVETLAEALRRVGYRTVAFRSHDALRTDTGFAQGFDRFENLDDGDAARAALAGLGERDFVWVHIDLVSGGYRAWVRFLDRLVDPPADLPQRLGRAQLERYYDPATTMSTAERGELWALYCLSVAKADDQLGGLLAALHRSGREADTLIAVTADVGQEFGEYGQALSGGSLGRRLIEVPLVVKLPGGRHPSLDSSAGPVAAPRLFATLLEVAGATAVPAAAPSLFHRSRSALSELYARDGTNQYSLVDGDLQLLRTVAFAAPEPDYYRARLDLAGLRVVPPLAEGGAAVLARLATAFSTTPPFRGRGMPAVLRLLRWTENGASPVEDEPRREELAARLAARWHAFAERERSPGEEARERGWYIVGSRPATGALGSIAQR